MEELKSYHHIHLDDEFRNDCKMWLEFLDGEDIRPVVCRPWIDISLGKTAAELQFFTDASGSLKHGGLGGVFEDSWIAEQWNKEFLRLKEPSIEYLELFALTAAVLTWREKLKNIRFTLFCDNQAVVNMINNISSSCKNCMVLIRKLVRVSLECNFRIFAKYIRTEDNGRADAFSRNQMSRFRNICARLQVKVKEKDIIPAEIWPVEKLWLD